jgi:hypothetical protein
MELASPAGSLSQVHERVQEAMYYLIFSGYAFERDFESQHGIHIDIPFGRKAPPMWFRGHEQRGFELLPNILRPTKHSGGSVQYATYDQYSLRDETRSVQFPARVAHLMTGERLNGIEWQEITQHYGSKTRLLDWTESLYVALTVALEPHLANPADLRFTQRALSGTAPHLWVLNPILLNMKLYDFILRNPALTGEALREFSGAGSYDRIRNINAKLRNVQRYILDDEYATSGIISLSALENLRTSIGSRLPALLELGEFNPYFYLLLRIFSDRLQFAGHIPPLAILHPYHSSRIAKQRGAFTIFALPPVGLTGRTEQPRSMEQFVELNDCIVKINLVNLQKISDELLRVGQTRAELYPEVATYAEELEWGAGRV